MKQILRKFKRDDRGMAAIEAAFCFPVLIILFVGMFELTSAISVNRRVTLAASVMADIVTRHNATILQTQIADYYNAAAMAMSPTPSANVRVELFGFRKVGASISQIWKSSNNLGSSCGGAPAVANMGPLMVSGNDLVVARVCTTYTPVMTSFWGVGTVAVSETITDRPRISAALTCYTTVVGGAVCS
jgi:Flp pilus assembly protein TadG